MIEYVSFVAAISLLCNAAQVGYVIFIKEDHKKEIESCHDNYRKKLK